MERFSRSSCFTSLLAAGGVLLALALSGCEPEKPETEEVRAGQEGRGPGEG